MCLQGLLWLGNASFMTAYLPAKPIYPKQHDDWMVVPNQWGVIIGRPSAIKTPALKQALLPLRELDARERERYSQAFAEYKAVS